MKAQIWDWLKLLVGLGLVLWAFLWLASLPGCTRAERVQMTQTMVDRAVEKIAGKLQEALPPPPEPDGPYEEGLAALAATVAVVGHRMWFHKKKGG